VVDLGDRDRPVPAVWREVMKPDFWNPPEGLREPSESFPEVVGDVVAGPIVEAPEPPVRPRERHWWYFQSQPNEEDEID
jgi:hypothetical protein